MSETWTSAQKLAEVKPEWGISVVGSAVPVPKDVRITQAELVIGVREAGGSERGGGDGRRPRSPG
ncbi:MAG TPA: hypothetical protein VLW50_24440 [Streptosporangiaceae bacterium]|nr:hypothetical protein [Streptosporangiaceae bacterium]